MHYYAELSQQACMYDVFEVGVCMMFLLRNTDSIIRRLFMDTWLIWSMNIPPAHLTNADEKLCGLVKIQ